MKKSIKNILKKGSNLNDNLDMPINKEKVEETIKLQKEILKRVREVDWNNFNSIITI